MLYVLYGCMLYGCCMIAIQRDSAVLLYESYNSKYSRFSYSIPYSTEPPWEPLGHGREQSVMHHSTLCEALHPSDRLPFSPEGSFYAHGSCRGRIHGMLRPFSRWSQGVVMGHEHDNHTANHTAFSSIQQDRTVTLYGYHTAAIQRCMPYSHTAHTAYNFIHPPSEE